MNFTEDEGDAPEQVNCSACFVTKPAQDTFHVMVWNLLHDP